MVTKVVQSIDRDVMRKMLMDNVIPAIKAKWPRGHRRIIIQQDNAKPHTIGGDAIIDEALMDSWFDISLVCQPPNSPDFNVLDLGFFNSIQALQHQKCPKNIDDLIECTYEAFNKLGENKLNDVFLSLQTAMESAMGCGGGNNYKLKHIHKEKLRRLNILPSTLTCNEEAIQNAKHIIEYAESSLVDSCNMYASLNFDDDNHIESAIDLAGEYSETLNIDVLIEAMDPLKLQ